MIDRGLYLLINHKKNITNVSIETKTDRLVEHWKDPIKLLKEKIGI